MNTALSTLALGPIGWQEMVILGILGVLIFGKRLPEVGRSIGKGIVEFKKGLTGIDDEIDRSASHDAQPPRIESQSTGSQVNTTSTAATNATPPSDSQS